MSMAPIQGIAPIRAVFPAEEVIKSATVGDGGFSSVFRSAIDSVKETDAEKNQMEYLLATGQLDNPAELMTALSKAQTATDLLIQMRNRTLDAYGELMRISL